MVTERCKWKGASGFRCKNFTKDSSGYCHSHKGLVEDFIGDITLHCDVCIVKDECDFYKKTGNDLCYFETRDETLELKDREAVAFNMRRLIKNEINILRRQNRLVNRQPEPQVIHEFRLLSDIVLKHLRDYGVFCGFQEVKVTKTVNEKNRMYILQQIFGEPSQKVIPDSEHKVKTGLKKIFGEGVEEDKEILIPTVTIPEDIKEEINDSSSTG